MTKTLDLLRPTDPPLNELFRRLFGSTTAPGFVYEVDAKDYIGSRGQRWDTRERYLNALVLTGHAVRVQVHAGRVWTVQTGEETTPVYDEPAFRNTYVSRHGAIVTEHTVACSFAGEFYTTPGHWQVMQEDAARLSAEIRAKYEAEQKARSAGPEGQAERLLNVAFAAESARTVSVYRSETIPDEDNDRPFSVHLYLTEEQLGFLCAALLPGDHEGQSLADLDVLVKAVAREVKAKDSGDPPRASYAAVRDALTDV